MKQITLNNKEYLLYPIEENEHTFFKQDYKSHSVLSCKIGNTGANGSYNDPDLYIDYKIIGNIFDILKDEDICKGLVEKDRDEFYKEYNEITWAIYPYEKATESFLSYLQSIDLDLTKQFLLIQKL